MAKATDQSKKNAKGREILIGSYNLPASKMTEDLTEVLRNRRLYISCSDSLIESRYLRCTDSKTR